ncbi:MAG: ATP phosphoribosyltransferase regulatory subunit, partial [Pseudomonadota bacterium]
MTELNSHNAKARIEAMLAARGAPLADVPVLQPAEPFLDTAGDELRRRIFMAQGTNGANMCLRPEFTIPVCLEHLATQQPSARYGYVGEVFRQARAEGIEFLQAGIEDIGDHDTIAADARAIRDATDLLAELAPSATRTVTLGDQAIFDAVLRALDLPSGWRVRLADAFGDGEAMTQQLAALASPAQPPALPDHIASLAATGEPDALAAAVAADMGKANLPLAGGRTALDIATRLIAKHADASHAA